MTTTIRLTAAQAVVRYLAAQRVDWQGRELPLFGGVMAIFGHGNVAGLGEALAGARDALPTYRAHNEQAMAHTAIAYAKAHFRRRMMVCTTSIGPGATNLVTAAACAHVNRLPVLLIPGDVFVSRAPDPVLQQVEHFGDGTVSANDCFRPVSRYFDRLINPEHVLTALPRAISVLTDPAQCGPVTLAFPQDAQTMAYEYPASFFEPQVVAFRTPPPDPRELAAAVAAIQGARRPLVVAGGGVPYSLASEALLAFTDAHGIPVAETQAGKGSLRWDHPLQAGAIGVTGAQAANDLARQADVVIAVGTRLQDFTTGSHTLFPGARIVGLNVNAFDAEKWDGLPLIADAGEGLRALSSALGAWRCDRPWTETAQARALAWRATVAEICGRRELPAGELPYEGEVIGAIQRSTVDSPSDDIVVCAAGTLPGELHKLWRAGPPGSYHVEYGYSTMGYEIAGGIGVKMARPEREVIVLVGDGSYLMLNSELHTSVMLGRKLVVVVLDNRGFGCIDRLQRACGGVAFNNLFTDCAQGPEGVPAIDFAAHARALGANAEHVGSIPALEDALRRARAATKTSVIVIDTDAARTTEAGGWWWEVAVPEVSARDTVRKARAAYETGRKVQRP